MKRVANWIAFALILLAVASQVTKPNPPGPGPGPVKGMRVVFVWESSQTMPKDQAAAFFSTKIDEWLDAHCEGGREGHRRWDKDVDVSAETEIWKAIWADTKPKIGTLPQILVVGNKDPQKGKFYPFPKNMVDLQKFLDALGGK